MFPLCSIRSENRIHGYSLLHRKHRLPSFVKRLKAFRFNMNVTYEITASQLKYETDLSPRVEPVRV